MEEKILDIFRDVLDDEEVTLDTKKSENDSWDSAANLIILATIEDELNIEVPIEAVPNIESPRDFLKYVR